MSGIVRGWCLREVVPDGRANRTIVWRDDDKSGEMFPVAVVPLDDATLAGCVEKARDAYRAQWHTEFDATDGDIDEAARLRIWLVAVRAALGLGGEGA